MRKLRADIAPVDSHETSKAVGVDVYMGTATFTGKHELEVGGKTLRFRKAVIATGGRAKVPPNSRFGSSALPHERVVVQSVRASSAVCRGGCWTD